MNICVTGARGVLGSRLVRHLMSSGRAARIVALDATPPSPLAPCSIESVVATLEDEAALQAAVSGCDLVVHLAALVDAGESLSRPVAYFETNTVGTARVLDACRRSGVRRVVYASTAHVYGVPRRNPVSETDPLQPLSPYAASKLAGEVAVHAGAAAFGLSCDVLRFVNLYGAPYSERTVVGRALRSAVAGGPISLRTLSPVRDFLYVDDAVETLARIAMSALEPGESRVLNVGTGIGRTVGDMAAAVAAVAVECGLDRPDVIETDPGVVETVPTMVVNTERLRTVLGWHPATTLEAGVRQSFLEMTAGVS